MIAIVLSYRYCTIAIATGFFFLQNLQYFNNNAASKTKEIREYHDHPNIIMFTVVCRLMIFTTVLLSACYCIQCGLSFGHMHLSLKVQWVPMPHSMTLLSNKHNIDAVCLIYYAVAQFGSKLATCSCLSVTHFKVQVITLRAMHSCIYFWFSESNCVPSTRDAHT